MVTASLEDPEGRDMQGVSGAARRLRQREARISAANELAVQMGWSAPDASPQSGEHPRLQVLSGEPATRTQRTPPRHSGAMRQFGRVCARSEAMHEVFDALDRFAKTEVSVTLVGETGAGKDILAHALHAESARASGPFVVFDCGAVAANLAESELLGHERGAFTGAVTSHVGAFERAHGGTLFLDEIDEMPVELQPRLLRALESRSVRRVGGKQERKIDVRIVAATNRVPTSAAAT